MDATRPYKTRAERRSEMRQAGRELRAAYDRGEITRWQVMKGIFSKSYTRQRWADMEAERKVKQAELEERVYSTFGARPPAPRGGGKGLHPFRFVFKLALWCLIFGFSFLLFPIGPTVVVLATLVLWLTKLMR